MDEIIAPVLQLANYSLESSLTLNPGGMAYFGFTATTDVVDTSAFISAFSYAFLGVSTAAYVHEGMCAAEISYLGIRLRKDQRRPLQLRV